jgi:hypothetical protein
MTTEPPRQPVTWKPAAGSDPVPPRQRWTLLDWLLPFAVGTAAVMAMTDVVRGPGRLSELIRTSDYIVVATCTRTQALDVATLYQLDFTVAQKLKGDVASVSLILGERASPVFSMLIRGRPCLLFLRRVEAGQPKLTTSTSAVALEGPDASLPAVVVRKLAIEAMADPPARVSALKQLAFAFLAADGDSYIKENLAEDLLELHLRDPALRLSAAELDSLGRAATNARSSQLAIPLALLLERQNAPDADAACLHAFLQTDALVADEQFRLAPALARRAALRERFVREIEATTDPARIGQMLTQLHQVDETTQTAFYERLWQKNPATRAELKHLMTQPTASRALKNLARRLAPESVKD